MIIGFRIDDVAPDMNWEKFNRIKEIFNDYNVKPLIGIIPNNGDISIKFSDNNPKFWEIMSQLKEIDKWVIAQHGYSHIMKKSTGGILGINNYGEFADIDFEVQFEEIKKGKEILTKNKLNTEIFMAPAHSYDENTLTALRALDFKYLTDGYSICPYEKQGLKFIPCQISYIPKKWIGLLTICLHPNNMTEKDFIKIESYLKNNREKIFDFDRILDLEANNFKAKITEFVILSIKKVKKKLKGTI